MNTPKPWRDLTDAEKGALLLAHHEGVDIEIQRRVSDCCNGGWICVLPEWDDDCVYRIAPEPLTPDSINWEHVSPEYNFMARDKDDEVWLYRTEPEVGSSCFLISDLMCRCQGFSSYKRGTVDWKDSLIIRPGYEGK